MLLSNINTILKTEKFVNKIKRKTILDKTYISAGSLGLEEDIVVNDINCVSGVNDAKNNAPSIGIYIILFKFKDYSSLKGFMKVRFS